MFATLHVWVVACKALLHGGVKSVSSAQRPAWVCLAQHPSPGCCKQSSGCICNASRTDIATCKCTERFCTQPPSLGCCMESNLHNAMPPGQILQCANAPSVFAPSFHPWVAAWKVICTMQCLSAPFCNHCFHSILPPCLLSAPFCNHCFHSLLASFLLPFATIASPLF